MKFLIFGGTGFVGRHLSNYIKERGEEVLTISRSGNADSLALDITQKEEFSKIDFLPDVVVNCASKTPTKGKSSTDSDFLKELFMTNVIGAANIANWAIRTGVPSIINCSTLVVVKKPWPEPLKEEYFALPDGFHVGYAMSKLSQEQIMDQVVIETGTKVLHARLSAVYGEDMAPEGLMFRLLEKFLQDEEVVLEDGSKNSVDLIHVTDVSRAIFAIAKSNPHEKVMNLAGGEEISIFELAEVIKNITGSNSVIKDKQTGRPESKANIDISKMKNILGDDYEEFWTVKKGLSEIVKNFRQQGGDELLN